MTRVNLNFKKYNKGFSFIKAFLVFVFISIIIGGVVGYVNQVDPVEKKGQAENDKREIDVNTILDAVYQYADDHNGQTPQSIPSGYNCEGEEYFRICKTGASSCTNLVDLSVLTINKKYLDSIPVNPELDGENFTGYYIIKDSDDKITVCAPDAYKDIPIRVTR